MGSIIESGFVGRESTPAGITTAFAEFWSETYAKYPVPEEGWPAEIQTCLGIPDEVDQLNHDDPWGSLSLSPPFRGAQEVSPDGKAAPVGSPFKLSNARFRSASLEPAGETGSSAPQEAASVAQPCRPVTPTTPVTARSRASTPPRPHKLPSTVAQSSPTSPDSPSYAPYPPSTPSTPKRTTPLRLVSPSKAASPSKRRKLDNKENESPGPFIVSVMERIITASPRSGHDLAMSKKHASPNQREEERPSKRSKMDGVALLGGDELPFRPSASSDSEDAEEERVVEFSLVEQQEQSTPSPTAGFFGVDEGVTPLSKKRKRFVFDAVEVPSVRQVYSRVKDTLPLAFAAPSKLSPTEARLTSQAARRALAPGNSRSVSRKRRRDSDDDPFNDHPASSARESSSDDDVYFGQVTPFHVCSPAIRRARDDDPPSSDDSNMSASPLKAVVSRRLQKTASNRRLPAASVPVQ